MANKRCAYFYINSIHDFYENPAIWSGIVVENFNGQHQNHHSPLIPVEQETDPTRTNAEPLGRESYPRLDFFNCKDPKKNLTNKARV